MSHSDMTHDKNTNTLYDSVFGIHGASNKTFLYTEQDEVSFATFTALTNQIANVLTVAGLTAGDRVAVQARKSVMQLALYAATVKAGGVYVPLNTGYTAHELDYFISNAKASFVIVDESAHGAVSRIAEAHKATLLILNADETGTLAASAASQPDTFDAVPRGPKDLGAILYTSGTTGRSKGAMLSHRNLLSNTQVLEQTWKFTSVDTLLHMLPIYHTHGLFVACNLLAMVGGSIIFLTHFDTERALHWLPRATSMMGVPTFYTRLLADDRFSNEIANHMRLFISGSAPLLATTHIEFESRTGHRILERYGMTETNMSTSNPYDGERRAGTVGMALPGVTLRIADEAGATVKKGEIGIIELLGDNVFSGYWEMPEKTAESFRDDGFFITGDLAREDEDGYITIVGRDKDLIISGGLNIYPKEIETLIDAQDGVTESAVIGVPHPDFGEGVVAVLVANENVTADVVMAGISDKLAKFKQPKKILFADSLPRNTMGKVQKAIMRKEHHDTFSS